MPMEKTFDPAAIEAKWAHEWESRGLFRPARPDATPFTIVNPPPNVTGALHIGHALDNTLQDVLVRYERLRGKDALWVVGMDHAGIATQMVVERQMEERQDKRTNYSREDFIDKVWQWKAESGGQITGQLRRLGCSMDWSREQFTMDPHFTAAVVKVFVDLHKKGLIYRDKRLVNWDPKLKTAISDLEVETHEIQGGFWHFKYPLADGVTLDDGRDFIVVATTRPETMLADMAVAVHPNDARYKSVIGKDILQPITGRRFKVVADEHADPELGSGAVKITPGHDFNDFDVGKRAGFKAGEMLNMLDGDANVIQTADGLIPAEYLGLHRFKRDGKDGARELVVTRMKEAGFLIPHVDKDGGEHDAEPRTIQTPFGDRGGVVIEPWLTDQWYVDAETLAQPPMQAVRDSRINIVPKTWEKTFFNWMENIQPWCVSRQLWWGHRIPAWYGPSLDVYGNPGHGDVISVTPDFEPFKREPIPEKVFVAENEDEALRLASEHYPSDFTIKVADDRGARDLNAPKTIWLTRDEDVLDTWFSSALWPFATLGWPEDTELLRRHYPNDVLVSGFDILFFWDARMAMQGMEFMGDVPWKTLYLHGLVRAPDGAKMSKSKGNVVDPLGLIDQYGADALRFFMSAMESQGRDIKMDDARLAGYRNFATKLWNAARFCEANGISASTSFEGPAATLPVNRWIIGEVAATVAAMETAFAAYRFDEAANAIYSFAWDRFCDWYLELIKGAIDDETKAVAGWVLDQILVMLHPFMPFITEELWTGLGDRADYPLITAKWPAPAAVRDADASADIDWLIKLVSELRTAKAELGLPPGARLTAHFPASLKGRTDKLAAQLDRLARLEAISFDPAPAGASAQLVVEGETITVPLEGVIDIAAERDRLTKALAAAAKERDGLAGRLNNPSFVERAKPEAVEKARADHAAKEAEADRLTAALARLG
ncbi:valine--tRNA ligase [Sphingopyxis sp. H038]|uniref:valine--tRNA ligase n=1 Tax=unclassified Sphingopyxis TaxID=2614943 RepID=UPI00073032A5|nr:MULTISPECIES: valine--tRNA ligase [unclassified Sphingopyxis]KTE03138.1 valine--tRNA ligase [Sphingopyxis sp. H012]KTE10517.1 valine--tRNA ligase [Sphingopyxis sp. H053]KTE14560.1 valine--tRNA ligase [Sphingopyxis sp. H093]KTE28702.1 valine--tRNA ligase [Sphingopyxis sp. H080]KTE36120.1 valine--tRNA ligase [Sphingopyxis sp. H038]